MRACNGVRAWSYQERETTCIIKQEIHFHPSSKISFQKPFKAYLGHFLIASNTYKSPLNNSAFLLNPSRFSNLGAHPALLLPLLSLCHIVTTPCSLLPHTMASKVLKVKGDRNQSESMNLGESHVHFI